MSEEGAIIVASLKLFGIQVKADVAQRMRPRTISSPLVVKFERERLPSAIPFQAKPGVAARRLVDLMSTRSSFDRTRSVILHRSAPEANGGHWWATSRLSMGSLRVSPNCT